MRASRTWRAPARALQLPCDFDDLRDAVRAQRMALREQSAAGIDGHTASDAASRRRAAGESFAAGGEPQRFVVKELGDRERIVQLDDVEVARAIPACSYASRAARARDLGIEDVVAVLLAHAALTIDARTRTGTGPEGRRVVSTSAAAPSTCDGQHCSSVSGSATMRDERTWVDRRSRPPAARMR